MKTKVGRIGKLITINGVTKNQAGWARELGISREAFRLRVVLKDQYDKYGKEYDLLHLSHKPHGEYLSKYVKRYSKCYRRFGVSIDEMSKKWGMSRANIYWRIKKLEKDVKHREFLTFLCNGDWNE